MWRACACMEWVSVSVYVSLIGALTLSSYPCPRLVSHPSLPITDRPLTSLLDYICRHATDKATEHLISSHQSRQPLTNTLKLR
mmetsp:Transcript_44227/g.125115  ORF Transcript_44227/g.125115 Transcript_44227/m.125115 type:complete len:83 (-) Transcript_44227:36-284(-)